MNNHCLFIAYCTYSLYFFAVEWRSLAPHPDRIVLTRQFYPVGEWDFYVDFAARLQTPTLDCFPPFRKIFLYF